MYSAHASHFSKQRSQMNTHLLLYLFLSRTPPTSDWNLEMTHVLLLSSSLATVKSKLLQLRGVWYVGMASSRTHRDLLPYLRNQELTQTCKRREQKCFHIALLAGRKHRAKHTEGSNQCISGWWYNF